MVTQSSGILAENKTAECLTRSIVRTFKEGGKLLEGWRTVLTRLHPHHQDLIYMIPQSNELTLTKLATDGMVSTDTCNTAHKTERLLCEVIRKLCFEKGLMQDELFFFGNDCWNHLRNVWFDAIVNELSSLGKVLQYDLNEIHPKLRVTTDPNAIFWAIEKFFGETANYANGSGSMYYDYMHTYNPKSHHYQITCALGGTRQDIGASEGAMAVFMNIPYFLDFLDW
jgi:hypothetical protein